MIRVEFERSTEEVIVKTLVSKNAGESFLFQLGVIALGLVECSGRISNGFLRSVEHLVGQNCPETVGRGVASQSDLYRRVEVCETT